jgi:hypothetical protein
MEDGSPESKNSGKKSTKRLVRILVIVGIGIPVLVELLTLFNLVNVQLFTDEDKPPQQGREVEEAQSYVQGDTLFTEFAHPIIIHSMRIMVSTRQWRYELSLVPADTTLKEENIIRLDSLSLESGKVLTPVQALRVRDVGVGEESDYHGEWELPSGDLPKMLYLSSVQPIGADSTELVRKEVRLGNIPIRYEQEE